MTRTKIILVVSFVITFAAGGVVGRLILPSGHRPPGPSFLAAELNLTSQQRDQMHTIWTEIMRTGGRREWDQRKALAQERDQAVAALLTPEQRPQYEKVLQDHTRKLDELSQERKRNFDQAVERTKQILNPEQVKKYEELLKKPRERGFGGPPGPPPWADKGPPRDGPHDKTGKDEREPSRGGE